MTAATLVIALLSTARSDPAPDARTVFALLERYRSTFLDVTFLHEGTLVNPAGESPKPADTARFQSYYAYRNDGATLLDTFVASGDGRNARTVRSVLNGRLETLDATPEYLPPVRDRVLDTTLGGPGSLAFPGSPERIFVGWYLRDLGDPAERDTEVLGWEDIEGHRCLGVKMLRYPKPSLKGWMGGLPFVKLWIDLERDGYPLRIEFFSGDNLEVRTEITRLERFKLPDGHTLWLPTGGKTSTYVGGSTRGGMVRSKEPLTIETHGILRDTVRFNQGLKDDFFSTKRHALVANDEDLKKLLANTRRNRPRPSRVPPHRSGEHPEPP